jgi:antitoxin HigA-1
MTMLRIPTNREPVSPGEMLAEEFMKPLGLTQTELARRLGIRRDRLNEIINGRRAVTPSTALLLARAFGTSPEFWLNGQLTLDLYRAQHDEREIAAVSKVKPVVSTSTAS